jgi:uncharacterized membrane protein
MSFRERSAWVMVLALLIAGAKYLAVVAEKSLVLGHVAPPLTQMVIVYIVFLVVIAVFGQTAVALLSPREAEAGADERDRLIAARAGHVFGQVLAVGVVSLLGAYLLSPHRGDPTNGDMLFQGMLIALMVAQIAEYATQIWFYRRGL